MMEHETIITKLESINMRLSHCWDTVQDLIGKYSDFDMVKSHLFTFQDEIKDIIKELREDG